MKLLLLTYLKLPLRKGLKHKKKLNPSGSLILVNSSFYWYQMKGHSNLKSFCLRTLLKIRNVLDIFEKVCLRAYSLFPYGTF